MLLIRDDMLCMLTYSRTISYGIISRQNVYLARALLLTYGNLKYLMKIIPKLALTSVAICVAMLAFAPNVKAITNLTFNDQYVVGTISPGAPADPADVATYINHMITLGLGQSDTFSGQTITRSNNVFANLPNADANIIAEGTTTVIDLGAGGVYTYLFAKYDGQNDNSLVWNVSGLTGIITIPLLGPLGHGLSGWILFGPGGGTGVPDGGTTVMLLGTALGALGMARRFLKI
jgi:VPDSG-CTERM motif